MRRRMLASVGNPLPYDAEVEWLYSDGATKSPWVAIPIDFNVLPFKVELSWYVTDRPRNYGRALSVNGANGGGELIVRSFGGRGTVGYEVVSYKGNIVFKLYNDTTSNEPKTTTVTVGTNLIVDFTQSGYTGRFAASGFPDGTGAKLCLWVGTSTGYVAENFCGRIYGLKVWSDGVLKMDLIAVKKDGVGYFYDKVSKSMLGNTNANATVQFGIGPDKAASALSSRGGGLNA